MGNALKKNNTPTKSSGPFFANEQKAMQHKSHRKSKERERKERKEKESIASSNKSSKSKGSKTTQVIPIKTNTGSLTEEV